MGARARVHDGSRSRVIRTDAIELADVCAHGGEGLIGFDRLVTGEAGQPLHFVDLAVVPYGSSIGVHTHGPDEEEYYFVIEGTATMTLNGESVEVGPGDLVRNPPGGTHSLVNDRSDTVRLLVFEIQAR